VENIVEPGRPQMTIRRTRLQCWIPKATDSYLEYVIGKGKAVPLQAWTGPGGSRKSRFPDFVTTVHDGGKVVSLTHRPPLPPGNTAGTHLC